MALQLINPVDKFLLKQDVVSTQAVIGHLRSVLHSFANKPGFTRFYIGITNNLQRRLSEHRADKPLFQWMCPVMEEAMPHVAEGSFDALERDAILAFRAGIRHPDSRQMLLSCDNAATGTSPKNYLYVLVG
jgi:hypothetical protein